MKCENVMCINYDIRFPRSCDLMSTLKAVKKCSAKQVYDGFVGYVKNEGAPPSCNLRYAKLPDRAIERCAMAIVHRIGENVGASVAVRQSTNDVNIDETIETIGRLLSGNFA